MEPRPIGLKFMVLMFRLMPWVNLHRVLLLSNTTTLQNFIQISTFSSFLLTVIVQTLTSQDFDDRWKRLPKYFISKLLLKFSRKKLQTFASDCYTLIKTTFHFCYNGIFSFFSNH